MKIKIIDFGYKSLPERAHENDAGADVRVCLHDCENIMLLPCQSVKIPLGMGLVLPDGYAAFVYPRSGLASKGITCELPPIDSGYRGEIHAIITNCSTESVCVENGMKIGQLVVMPIVICDFITEDIKERGDAGFGSTGV